MAESVGEIVTKSSQINEFTNRVRNLIRNSTVWYIGSGNPGVGFPTSYLGGGKDPGGPGTSSLSSAAIDASILANAFQSWGRQYTRVRRFRFVRTGNLAPTDQTQITHMSNSFLQSGEYADINNTANQNAITQGSLITATNFNNFVGSLYNKWNSDKNNTYTYVYNYCHSSCHNSCHGAGRGRR